MLEKAKKTVKGVFGWIDTNKDAISNVVNLIIIGSAAIKVGKFIKGKIINKEPIIILKSKD